MPPSISGGAAQTATNTTRRLAQECAEKGGCAPVDFPWLLFAVVVAIVIAVIVLGVRYSERQLKRREKELLAEALKRLP